jgi:hypothetical protein
MSDRGHLLFLKAMYRECLKIFRCPPKMCDPLYVFKFLLKVLPEIRVDANSEILVIDIALP